jgi:carboxymethylenebutenolidase
MAAGRVAGVRFSPVYLTEWRRMGASRVDEEQRMTTPTMPSTTTRMDPDPLSPLNQMQRYLVHEFVEDYQDGLLSRRDLMTKLGYIAGGSTAAAAILTWFGVSADEAHAQEASTPVPADPQSPISVPADDPSVTTTEITVPSGGVDYIGYEARPADGIGTPMAGASPMAGATPMASAPALILVCHENRGLTDHIRDVTRRLAKIGYVAVALDLVSPDGGTAAVEDPNSIPDILTAGDFSRHVTAFKDTISFYQSNEETAAQRVGMIGFCIGGGITWQTATMEPRLLAAVPFYGPPPPLDQVPNITAAVLGIYSDDPGDFANEGREDLVAALEAAGVTHQINVYPGTQHAFHNDTGPRYNEEQALAAWHDTLAWFAQYLG